MTATPDTQLAQIMESIRKQDDLVHGWTKTLVTVQGGIVAAVGLLWSAAPATIGTQLQATATIALAAIAIVACWTFVMAAISDLSWQGRYINYAKVIAPSIFLDVNPSPDNWGRQATLYFVLGAVMTIFWLITIVAAIARWSCV